MLKIIQAKLQQYVNCEFPDVQAGFRKGRGPEIKLPTSTGSSKKQESFRKIIYFCFIDYTKALDCVGHNKLWSQQTKFLKPQIFGAQLSSPSNSHMHTWLLEKP